MFVICINRHVSKKGDSQIIITLNDSSGIHEKVKLALIKADFVVKELNSLDSVVTYPRELKTMNGVAVGQAKVKNNKVTLYGYYSLKKLNYFGYTKLSRDFKPIVYYKGSKLWPLLMKVARDLGGEITYKD